MVGQGTIKVLHVTGWLSVINNSFHIITGKITGTSNSKDYNFYFPITLSTQVIGIAVSQSARNSSSYGRIALKNYTISSVTFDGVETKTTQNGAFYIVIGY